jgi:hypothetical protein
MANKKITELTELTSPAGADLFAIVDDTDTTTKKVTVSNLMTQAPVQAADISVLATQVSLGNHEALTQVHGISAFGATLVDDADASAARTTLGLGTAATTASTDYATSAQGALADSALQSGDNISTLTNDSLFITGVTAGELGDFDFDDNAIFGFAAKVETPTITANAYTLVDTDNGKVLALDNGATAMTLNVDTGLPASFNCSFIQTGSGQVSFAGTATVNNRQSHTKINGQYGVASIVAYATDTYILAGDTAA